jgi:metal-sulfur cluster biosynthetic enzyme
MPDRYSEMRDQILAALDEIKDPCSVASGTPLGLVEMGLIKQLDISSEGAVEIQLCLTAPFCHMIAFFKAETTARVGAIPGVSAVLLATDNGLDWSPERMSPAVQARRAKMFGAVAVAGQTERSGNLAETTH